VKRLENLLRKDIKITHRTLHHISIEAMYYAENIIKLLNSYINEDDSGEGLKDKIRKVEPTTLSSDVQIIINRKSTPTKEEQKYESSGSSESSEEYEESEEYEKSESSEKVDLEHLSDHELLWKKKYQTVGLSEKTKFDIVSKIKEYFIKIEEYRQLSVEGESDNRCIVIELFDYMAVEGYKIMTQNFKTTVVAKLEEFANDSEIFVLMKPKTKEFLYALSGTKY
jgi:hypothetical protein